jgi:hypothetical protein
MLRHKSVSLRIPGPNFELEASLASTDRRATDLDTLIGALDSSPPHWPQLGARPQFNPDSRPECRECVNTPWRWRRAYLNAAAPTMAIASST